MEKVSIAQEKTSQLEKDLKSLLNGPPGKAEIADLRKMIAQMGVAEANMGRVIFTSYPANNSDG